MLAAEGDKAGLEVHQEAGTDRLADLVNKDPVFDVCFTSPRLLACVAHVLADFKLSSLNFRAALPGCVGPDTDGRHMPAWHYRQPGRVSHAGGLYQVIPVGVFQPSGEAPWNEGRIGRP